ncbi:MAG: metallophosphoesterase [Spirochaetaceae bacterium]|jgi:predicted phosphodiesterase|nr:metallophosphoesterase [Spirochaetaceae bacterium]
MVARCICAVTFFFFLSACSVDLPGLIASQDLDVRLKDRDRFHFLTEADRNLTLEDAYEFLVLTDTHIQDGNAFGLENLASVINDARFVVILGDITQNGSEKDILKFISIAETLGVPCYPVIGNHDIYFNNWYNWRDHIGSSSYRINGSNTTLFILDTANAWVGNAQIKWLDKELETAKPHIFIFTHTNLFVEHIIDLQQTTDIRERARFMSLLDGRCEAFFTGHVHRRIIKTFGGVQYITIEDFRSKKTYCRVQVSPEGIRYSFEKL